LLFERRARQHRGGSSVALGAEVFGLREQVGEKIGVDEFLERRRPSCSDVGP